ncbi:MAG: GPI anchored serine-threonine rich family protein [Patescibacteria group bacterium]|nr:GPI anchored serine-threonine rich family protein [Patescibacteria group bacterium]
MKKESLSVMTVKILLVVIIFTGMGTIIIGGGLLVGKRSVQVESVIPIESYKDCSKLKGMERKDCYLNLAKKNKDESFCEKISTIEFRSMCYTDLAILKNNPELCSKATALLASSCREYFIKDEKLTIIYPNKNTIWKAGESYQVSWTPVDSELRVSIKLIDNSSESPDLAGLAEIRPFDTGSYSFFVPKNLKTNNKYHISITRHADSVPIYIAPALDDADSEEFTIISDESNEVIEAEKIIEINKTPNWPIYQNEELGFEITFTEVWKNYEVITERKNKEIYIGFRRPTKDLSVITENYGYVRIFSIFPIKIAEWEEKYKLGPALELGRKDGRIFVFMGMNGYVPEDQKEAIKDISKIISSFKFIKK